MRKFLLLIGVVFLVWPGLVSAQTQLDISGGFNMDSICGPHEFQELRSDGTQDLFEFFGQLADGNGNYVGAQNKMIVVNTTGTDNAYSITGDYGHPLNLGSTDAIPSDGVISGADRDYHMASFTGNATLSGDWTETADPSDASLKNNSIVIGAAHNKADWQIASKTIELPASQKGKYVDVNFLVNAQDVADLARNMRIVALYGATGADEQVIYSFSTANGGSGPVMTDTAAPSGFAITYTCDYFYNAPVGYTGDVRSIDEDFSLFEFATALSLDSSKTLWGFRIEDVDDTLNWNARGVAIFAATATPAIAQLDISGGFNMDSICGPKEFQELRSDGTQDLFEFFGQLSDGNGNYVSAQNKMIVVNTTGTDNAYSITGDYGHPLNLGSTDAIPSDGVISGADRDYHMASFTGNATLSGDWTETADPSDASLKNNSIVVGASHNKATWQIASKTVELPATQKGKYDNINFLINAQDVADLARNMRIIALYGATGADEQVIYSFSTANGGSGPVMTDTTAPTGFVIAYTCDYFYNGPAGTTGDVRSIGEDYSLFEFSSALNLDDSKDLWGFKIEDVDDTLNWNARGVAIFAATAARASATASNIAPVANAGSDQTVTDTDDNGSESVTLDATGSSDSDGTISSYVWEENSTQIATGVQPSVTLTQGTHTITLTVTDDDSATDTDTVIVTINDPPVANAGLDQTVVDTDDSGSETVNLTSAGSSDSDGTIASYSWDEGQTQLSTAASPSISLTVGMHTIVLTVTDDDGATDTDTVIITVDEPSRPKQLDISTGFNMDAWCGPKEFQELLTDGTQDHIQIFGGLSSGNGSTVLDSGYFIVVNSSGTGMEYSLSGDANHPNYYSSSEGSPADGVITGAGSRPYHIAGSSGNTTLSGDMTEVSDPSTYNNNDNCIYVGADHNKANFQISSVTVELPTAQKDQYDNVNFVIAAADTADLARNMRIVALYGDGTDEAILYSFSTANGGDGPLMTDSSYTGFSSVQTMSKAYSSFVGTTTGAVVDKTTRFWEFSTALNLNAGKTLYGFRFEDSDPSLNWNARGMVVFAATAMTASGSNALPSADAGADQLVHTSTTNASVTLDGTGSSDPDGSIASYSWKENSTEIATGSQPVVSLATGSHTIELTVTDDDSGTDTDTVVIDVNANPVADAGSDQTVYDDDSSGSESVSLDGGASSDSDGSISSYVWKENALQIATGSSPSPSLTVGTHMIELTVTDDDGGTATDTVVITVSDNHPPVANAGADQTVTDTNGDGSESVTLNASGSTDSDGTISSYVWTDSDGTQLSTSSSFSATVYSGINDIKLVVTDNDGASDSDVVRVWVIPDGDYYVDQGDSGASDSNAGSEFAPWLTIGHAVDNVSAGDVIIVKEGIYRETPTVGVSGTSSNPITLLGYPGDRVVISGADKVTGWTQCTSTIAKGNTNYTNIYYVDIAWKPTRLVQDDVELEIAATPWMGWRLCEGGANNTLIDTVNLTEADDYWNGATVYLWDIGSTVQYAKEVTDYDYSSGTLTISGMWTSNPAIVPVDGEDIYQLQNKVELIGAAGQWAVEDIGGGNYRVYCWVTGGGDPDNYTMEASRRDRFVFDWANGDYWTIDNLEIRHGQNYGMGTWNSSFTGNLTVQNCIIHHNDSTGIYGTRNVNGQYLRNVIIYNGLGLDNGGEDNVLFESNEIAWNGVDGLRIIGKMDSGDYTTGVVARGNYIHDHYRWSHADNMQSYGYIENVDIVDNLVLSAGQSYMIEGARYFDFDNNTIIGSQAYMLIYGHGNVSQMTTDNNTLAYAGYGLVNHSGSDGYYHANNILVKGNNGSVWGNVDSVTNYSSDYNVFYIGPNLTASPVTWSGTSTFSAYQTASGEDANSVQADPLFSNAPAYYSALDTSKQYQFTSTRVYIPSSNASLFSVGDYIEIDWDGVVRTVTAVGTNYLDFSPGDTRIGFKANQVTNWLDNSDFTLDFTLKAGSPATGAADDSSDVGSDINVQQYMDCDFNGDGRRDIPGWPGE